MWGNWLGHGKSGGQFREFGPDCGELDPCEPVQQHGCGGCCKDGYQRAGNPSVDLSPQYYDGYTADGHYRFSWVYGLDILEITYPLGDES